MIITEDGPGLFERFSSFSKLIRINALCLRFMTNAKGQGVRTVGRIITQELVNSSLRLVKIVQQAAFKQDLHALKTQRSVSRKNKLSCLSPFIDELGIIRVGGRLQGAAISRDAKHPILLPGNHPFTYLVIQYEHQRQLHARAQTTLAAIRNKYWPLSARNSIKKYIRECITCRKADPHASEAIMSDLPAYRVTSSKPFERSGVDYCGPFHIRSGQLRNTKIVKAYVAVFICLSTKAVHIELVSSLSTEAFLNALKRFIARRGKVLHTYSDNGTNFQGASNTLKGFITCFIARIIRTSWTIC